MTAQSSKIDRLTAWRSKAFDFSFSDQMGTLVSRALELMISVVRNGTKVSNAEHFVRSLEFEQKLAMERDTKSELPIRELVYILCEGLGLTIDSIIESKLIEDQNQMIMIETAHEESTENTVDDELENINYLPNSVKYEDEDQFFDDSVDVDGPFGDNVAAENTDAVPSNQPTPMLTAAAAAAAAPQSVERSAGRPKRAAAAASESKLGEECDDAPVAKRERTKRDWDDGLQCPKCDKVCSGVNAITIHLKRFHETTPTNEGIVFLCKCGNETVSSWHANSDPCGRSKSAIIIKRQDSTKYKTDDTKEDFEDAKDDKTSGVGSAAANFEEEAEEEVAAAAAEVAANAEVCDTPAARRVKADNPLECPQCGDVYRSVSGLLKHLTKEHSATPKKAGMVFKCGCDHETVSGYHFNNDPCGMASSTVAVKTPNSSTYK